jgi:DNA mismatch endonuclease (patch repair protein)
MSAERREYWGQKVLGNRRRDRVVALRLRQHGWVVVRVWEHDLAKPAPVAGKISPTVERRCSPSGPM